MTSAKNGAGDPYSRVEYRRVIAWRRRIEREGPFLRALLERAPSRAVLDLGCGTGEHVAFLAAEGARAVGMDASPSMIEAAEDHATPDGARFVLGDAREASALLRDEAPFGLILCLGNVLPHLPAEDDLRRVFASARVLLAPGGLLMLQILNYTRILERGERHLPLSFRDGEDGTEIVFLRLMRPDVDGGILFFPTTLEVDPDSEEPVRVRSTKRVPLRAWRVEDLGPLLEEAGFAWALHGDMQGGTYDPLASADLVVVATASPGAQ